ncbi:ABC transporter ATP-binding protein [Williamsia sp. DF01-3]|uniref:ABC transporter ATP-binding protein n=1 Tax=Williamsia sp. DF01-3 TaxID=2934157 RepID=UPI001FF10069|nr:ABC transporter ATP-binding protein [Williamsia sp. DF01-3]MCK0519290.1 ABC transporter ATP-binding protein [Williamsia sp. DF01-3]
MTQTHDMPAIEMVGLTKTFKQGKSTVEAVKGIDLAVKEGELVAFLGPNGAGKSTTLRMITTLLRPTSGSAWLAGHNIADEPDAVRRKIGYVGQGNGGGNNQRVREELITQGLCYGFGKSESSLRADELIAALDLTGMENRKVSTLSGGQRRRLDIALGIVHRPPVIFLDEPTTGMDPQSRANLWTHIQRLRAETGATIVLTTHYLDEADAMAERVVVIDKGTVIADDSAAALKDTLAGDSISLTADSSDGAAELARIATSIDAVRSAEVIGESVELQVVGADKVLPQVITAAAARTVAVRSASSTRPTLDDVFLSLTGRSLRETAAV